MILGISDESMPYWHLYRDPGPTVPKIELTVDEWADYQRVIEEFHKWQRRIGKRYE